MVTSNCCYCVWEGGGTYFTYITAPYITSLHHIHLTTPYSPHPTSHRLHSNPFHSTYPLHLITFRWTPPIPYHFTPLRIIALHCNHPISHHLISPTPLHFTPFYITCHTSSISSLPTPLHFTPFHITHRFAIPNGGKKVLPPQNGGYCSKVYGCFHTPSLKMTQSHDS